MSKKLEFVSTNAVTYTAFVRGDFMLHYLNDPWVAITRHFYDKSRLHNAAVTPERVKSELFPKLPLFACKNICLKLAEMGAVKPTSDNEFVLADKGKEIATTGKNLKPLSNEHALCLTWVNLGGIYAIVNADIQSPDAKSKTFTPEGFDTLAEILRRPILVKNGEATVVLTGNNLIFGTKFNGGAEEKTAKATLTLTPEKTTISVGKTPIALEDFPSLSDVFEDAWYRGLKLVFDPKAGKYKATVAPDFIDEFPFRIPIKDLGLPKVKELAYADFKLSANTPSVECVPADKTGAQKAFRATIRARLKRIPDVKMRKEKFASIVANVKNEFATEGFNNLDEPGPDDYMDLISPPSPDGNPPSPKGGIFNLFALTRKKIEEKLKTQR